MSDLVSKQAALKGLWDLNVASFYEENEHSKEAYTEIRAMLQTLPSVDAVPLDFIMRYRDETMKKLRGRYPAHEVVSWLINDWIRARDMKRGAEG